ncbi:MAG: rhamnulokinase [bacterium]|nr:rhamnulokinase [bacterium]
MKQYYLAVDIGASSGRHILGCLDNGTITLEEIYRFENGLKKVDNELCWDIPKLFEEIKNGLKKCKEIGKIPTTMGIDTWAVDFVLLDAQGKILGNTVGYRDSRTTGMDEKVYEIIPQEELYARTGIQKQIFNSIYQLMAVKEQHPDYLEKAETLLMIPDYFHYLLTGKAMTEYTNASTTQLVSPQSKDWDFELIDKLGYPRKIFGEISLPGSVVGSFSKEIEEEVGFSCTVVLPATHDTGSAVLSVPANDDNYIYISSGTWSLMGLERMQADCSPASMQANLTNEGGYEYRFRYLKNIMGLWMIQNVRKELNNAYSFAELCDMAAKETVHSHVDVNDACFLAPEHMITAIQTYCKEHNEPIPETPAQIADCVYSSLADSYAETVKELETLTGRSYERIHIVGGGSNASYLNQLTANSTKRPVYAGPTEATAIGNILAQMLHAKEFKNVSEARSCVFSSFGVKEFLPN